MKRSAVLLCIAIYAISAHAGSGKARLVAKVGSWMVLEHRHNQCRAFSENDGGQEMFALRPDGNGMWLELIDDKLHMPAGDYPVGISMNEYSVTTTGHVSSESPRTIVAVTLSKSEFTAALQNTTWITLDLDGNRHTRSVDGSSLLKALVACETTPDAPW